MLKHSIASLVVIIIFITSLVHAGEKEMKKLFKLEAETLMRLDENTGKWMAMKTPFEKVKVMLTHTRREGSLIVGGSGGVALSMEPYKSWAIVLWCGPTFTPSIITASTIHRNMVWMAGTVEEDGRTMTEVWSSFNDGYSWVRAYVSEAPISTLHLDPDATKPVWFEGREK